MKTRLPGGQTIVQLFPDLHFAEVSRPLIILGRQKIEDDGMPGLSFWLLEALLWGDDLFVCWRRGVPFSATSRRIWLKGLPPITKFSPEMLTPK